MKRKSNRKNITLSKRTIPHLNDEQMRKVFGGHYINYNPINDGG
jgi:natural product precursor